MRSHMPRPGSVVGIHGMPRVGQPVSSSFADLIAKQAQSQASEEAYLTQQAALSPLAAFEQVAVPVAPAAPVLTPAQARRTESIATADARAAFVPPVLDQQGSGEQEVIRWGDQQAFPLVGAPSGLPFTTSQLVKVHRRFPETWTLTLYARNTDPSSTAIVSVQFTVIIGCGSAQVNLTPSLIINNTALATDVVSPFFIDTKQVYAFMTNDFPANDIQVSATANASGGVNVLVAAFAAPRVFQPQPTQAPPSAASPGEQSTTWMPPGFHPIPVHYK